MRYKLAIIAGKLAKAGLRLLGRGGTALPGIVARFFDGSVLRQMASRVKFGSIVITGTNGKTTTARMISDGLDRNGYIVLNNRSGSNLERGLIATFLDACDWRGEVDADVAVLEIDEADLVNLISQLSVKQLIITNFFRDQLDRYGEILALRDLVKQAVEEMNAGASLVLNADDPLVASMEDCVPEGVEVKYFGLKIEYESDDFALDGRDCVNCGQELSYQKKYIAHLGDYSCKNCGYARMEPDVSIAEIESVGITGTKVIISRRSKDDLELFLPLPGVFNLYNLLAAVASVDLMDGVDDGLLKDAVAKFKPVFGRFEKVQVNDQEIYLMLSKNPTGFNELIKTLMVEGGGLNLVFILNDNYADGRDISWIWDIDLEKLRERINWLAVSGTRGEEMLLRVKYAEYPMERVGLEKNYRQLIADITAMPSSQRVFVLSTYTGMLELRAELQKKGLVEGFWND